MDIFIQSSAQISIQKPLCEDWFENPITYTQPYNRSIEPDYKQYINPMASRRMGKIIKRAVATSFSAIQAAEIENPDAIITGTGLGCIDNTEKFLSSMIRDGEQLLQPTFFMQSTHNTISSQIALQLKCHGYNCTYSHRGTSFESALADAIQQIYLGRISNALVGAHDEMTPDFFTMLGKIGYWKQGDFSISALKKSNTKGSFAGETSVAICIGTEKNKNSICKIHDVELLYKPNDEKLSIAIQQLTNKANIEISDIDAIMLGISGDCEFDGTYSHFATTFFPNKPILWYKHIFGESFTAPALGLHATIQCFKNKTIPSHLLYNMSKPIINPRNILIYNNFQNINHSLILVSQC